STLASAIDKAINSVTTGAATLGQYTTTVNNQISFTSSISDALTSGVGSLVDADMNVASTRLQALQTQQQLGIQALSMANQNSQLILKLFQ
ncbi:MAG: flagellin, partial [Janthinobacterium lividum]